MVAGAEGIAFHPAYSPGNTGPSCPQSSEFPVSGRKEAKPGWPGDSTVDGTSAWVDEFRPE